MTDLRYLARERVTHLGCDDQYISDLESELGWMIDLYELKLDETRLELEMTASVCIDSSILRQVYDVLKTGSTGPTFRTFRLMAMTGKSRWCST